MALRPDWRERLKENEWGRRKLAFWLLFFFSVGMLFGLFAGYDIWGRH